MGILDFFRNRGKTSSVDFSGKGLEKVRSEILAEYTKGTKLGAYFEEDLIKATTEIHSLGRYKITGAKGKFSRRQIVQSTLEIVSRSKIASRFRYVGANIPPMILRTELRIELPGKSPLPTSWRVFEIQIVPGVDNQGRKSYLLLRHPYEIGASYFESRYANSFAEIEAELPSLVRNGLKDLNQEISQAA